MLFALWEKDGIPITELSQKTMLERSTLTGMLDRLERDGLIVREPSSRDRRVLLIRRTDRDRSFQKKYLEVSDRMTELYYRGLTDREIDRFEKTLSVIL
ncbi:MarR family winged helix-turn-helix transcriptional regulator, partial [Desulfolutivibrio sp.]|uniref:MarR family winged helix-turn-helix transcriptional regulator n=1 Tax=Desulfolutivibrio sp. TaxID=2773296 RepID=UPI003FA44571